MFVLKQSVNVPAIQKLGPEIRTREAHLQENPRN